MGRPSEGPPPSQQQRTVSMYLQKKFVREGPPRAQQAGRGQGTGRLPPPTARIGRVEFGVLDGRTVQTMSTMEVVNRSLYDPESRVPQTNGVLDRRLGTSDKKALCETCSRPVATCVGHYGHVKLCLPVFHIGFFRECHRILHIICKTCARVMVDPDRRGALLSRMRNLGADWRRRATLMKSITEMVKKVKECPYCMAANGPVKKLTGAYRLYHDVHKHHDSERSRFRDEFEKAGQYNRLVKENLGKAHPDLTALEVLRLFRRVPEEDLPLLNMRPGRARPEDLIITNLVVPPVAIRPSVAMGSAGSNEDDLTVKLGDIVYINNFIRHAMVKGAAPAHIVENLDFLASQVAMYVNADMPGFPASSHAGGKPIRAFVQRLKGKMGRFRGNLSGKRVDFSSRSVISPDPNLRIDEVGVPLRIAKLLTYPERVTAHNREELRLAVLNGPENHPGANFIEFQNGNKVYLKYGKRDKIQLREGDVVERHLRNGDVVLFNRQPSLHKMSIMAHRARVMPWRTLRFNECVCKPYNADFDGDEMNMHVPQTEEARAEAHELMGVQHNLVTPRHGEPLVTATQDFLTACFLMTQRDVFYDRAHFMQICSFMGDASERVDMPPPAMIKPVRLWTGKQLIGVLLRPNGGAQWPLLNLELKARNYVDPPDAAPDDGGGAVPRHPVMCPVDGYVVIRNSCLLAGNLCKKALGGSKSGVFFALIRVANSAMAARVMNRMSKMCARWLGDRGFSFGIDDVTPSAEVRRVKAGLLSDGYDMCSEKISLFRKGQLKAQSGCDELQTLEAQLLGGLSRVREDAGKACLQNLNRTHNGGLVMAVCGSKGSMINISQMVACVGQQAVGGKRIQNGFGDRTLPHFERLSREPPARGFVANSFYSGLTATEFWFHTMAGREGLVDTAVKTAETGYMQRRLMKALEDMTVAYDGTVRTAEGAVVQFTYGDDGLDPVTMAVGSSPCNFDFLLQHVRSTLPDPEGAAVAPAALRAEAARARAVMAARERVRQAEVGGGRRGAAGREQEDGMDCDDGEDEAGGGGGAGKETDFTRGIHSAFLGRWGEFVETVLAPEAERLASAANPLPLLMRALTVDQFDELRRIVHDHYMRAVVEPGTAVGAIGAQSIGEPSTQMTLNTFHFSGVASMQVTQGVPRIKEIINSTEKISSPVVIAPLVTDDDVVSARIVKGRLERTTLGQIAEFMEEVYDGHRSCLRVRLDLHAIRALQLPVTAADVRAAICGAPKLKIKADRVHLRGDDVVDVDPRDRSSPMQDLQSLKQSLPGVVVSGVDKVPRAVINDVSTGAGERYELMVEGDDILSVMGTLGIRGTHVTTNSILKAKTVLGIEAARGTIAREISAVMEGHGLSVDSRHIALLADVMTYRGEILGITRFGVAKMKQSILMLASFEKTADHLFEAAIRGITDDLKGVSESIVLGQAVPLGTGIFKLMQRVDEVPRKRPRRAVLTARAVGRKRY